MLKGLNLVYVPPLPHDVVPHVDDPPHEVVPPVDEVTLHWSRKLRNHILDTRLSRWFGLLLEWWAVISLSYFIKVDSKGKLDVTLKENGIFEDNLEVIKTLVAQRDWGDGFPSRRRSAYFLVAGAGAGAINGHISCRSSNNSRNNWSAVAVTILDVKKIDCRSVYSRPEYSCSYLLAKHLEHTDCHVCILLLVKDAPTTLLNRCISTKVSMVSFTNALPSEARNLSSMDLDSDDLDFSTVNINFPLAESAI